MAADYRRHLAVVAAQAYFLSEDVVDWPAVESAVDLGSRPPQHRRHYSAS